MIMIITTIMMIVMIMMILTIMMITDMIMITQELFLLWCASPEAGNFTEPTPLHWTTKVASNRYYIINTTQYNNWMKKKKCNNMSERTHIPWTMTSYIDFYGLKYWHTCVIKSGLLLLVCMQQQQCATDNIIKVFKKFSNAKTSQLGLLP